VRFGERTCLAHRVSWCIAHGDIPAGLNVLHRCDNPPCVNPAHLFLGTQADNVRDAMDKGRKVNRPPSAETRRKMRLSKLGNTIKRDWLARQASYSTAP
jgi:hypothetical protein